MPPVHLEHARSPTRASFQEGATLAGASRAECADLSEPAVPSCLQRLLYLLSQVQLTLRSTICALVQVLVDISRLFRLGELGEHLDASASHLPERRTHV
jgi:hypothetical protein